jgi:hypothetical protein
VDNVTFVDQEKQKHQTGVRGLDQLYTSTSKICGQGAGVNGTASREKCGKTVNGGRRGEVLIKFHHSAVFQ